MRLRLFGLFLLIGLIAVRPVPAAAHANLARSEPPANARLTESPGEIRLWFTEPLEAQYSRIVLLDSSGAEISAPPSSIDAVDTRQLVLAPGSLPDDLYTVSWQSLSAADGHVSQGSFSFGIGVAAPAVDVTSSIGENIPLGSVLVRWFNFAGMSLLVGSLGFWLFVWSPASFDPSRRLLLLTGIGWAWLGLALVLILALQTATATGNLTPDAVWSLLTGTTFGALWWLRLALWVGTGLVLLFSRHRERWLWLALILSLGLLLAHSFTSHAAAAADVPVAVAVDWLHLLSSAFWLGGLVAFMLVLVQNPLVPEDVARLVAAFSNYARVAVAALVLTGLYSAWLQVGSLDALVSTVYGRTLLVKLLLFAPLLALAAANLLLTRRALAAGQRVWIGRLHGQIGAEIALLIGVLIAVGVMTAINPARAVQAERDAVAAAAAASVEPETYFQMQTTGDLMAHLEIVPGVVGDNAFYVTLADLTTGAAIEDASLIRLRFDHRDQNLEQSELRPELAEQSEYVASGSNLSIPGDWRVRMIVQRPGAFDAVIDFDVNVPAAATPAPVVWTTVVPAWERGTAALLVGLLLAGLSGFFAARDGLSVKWSARAFNGIVGTVGVFSLVFGSQILTGASAGITVRDAWVRPADVGDTTSAYLTIENLTTNAMILMEAQSPAAERVEFHQTTIENDFARMTMLEDLNVAAGETLQIAPPGTHLMLVGLNRDLVEGEAVPLRLTFVTGETIEVTAQVQMNAPESP